MRSPFSWVVALLLALALPRSAAAYVELRPTQITIAAERGDVVNRTVLLRSSEDFVDLSAQPMELLFEKQARVIPVHVIKVFAAPEAGPPTPRVAAFRLQINLAGIPAGEYVGDVSFTYKGGESKLPIKVFVRHRW